VSLIEKLLKEAGLPKIKPITNFPIFNDIPDDAPGDLSRSVRGSGKPRLGMARSWSRGWSKDGNSWRQLNKFESSFRGYAETKPSWRRRFSVKN